MPCETTTTPGQTPQQRLAEIRAVLDRLAAGLISGRYTVTVGPQGAVAFLGLSPADRAGVSDACAYRRLLVTGPVLARATLMQAEQRAGRVVDRRALAAGWHSHDGVQWHQGH